VIASFLLHTGITIAIWLVLLLVLWQLVSFEVSVGQLVKRIVVHSVVYLVGWPATVIAAFALMKHRGTWTVILEGEFSAQQTFFSLLIFYSGSLLTQMFLLMFDYEKWKFEAEEKEETEA
jgi:hypothetical protein